MHRRRRGGIDEPNHRWDPMPDTKVLSVFGVLEQDDWRLSATVAVALADQAGARLTLAKTTAPGW